jgi:hypothetical protein
MLMERSLVQDGHVHQLLVTHDRAGWDFIEEEDGAIIRHVHYDDWHRAERAIRRFEGIALELERIGWTHGSA